jgi:protein required for attachment to host cells
MKLVINTNTNTCRIYHYVKHPAQLTLLKEIKHPENRLKSGEMTSDRPGHYQGGMSARGAYSPHTEAKENAVDNFSREIAEELNKERNNKDYDELIVIAPPHMKGLLLQHINKHVKAMIVNNIEKDLLYMPEHELLSFLRENTQFKD